MSIISYINFISSSKPLKEIKRSGYRLMKVKDVTEVTKLTHLAHLNEESVILVVNNEEKIHELSITRINEPPNWLREYSLLEYVYDIEGGLKDKMYPQLYEYVMQTNNEIELWNIWSGYEKDEIVINNIPKENLKIVDIENLFEQSQCLRIT